MNFTHILVIMINRMIWRSVIRLGTITERIISENMKTKKTVKNLHSSDGKEMIQTMLGSDPEIRRCLVDSVDFLIHFVALGYRREGSRGVAGR